MPTSNKGHVDYLCRIDTNCTIIIWKPSPRNRTRSRHLTQVFVRGLPIQVVSVEFDCKMWKCSI